MSIKKEEKIKAKYKKLLSSGMFFEFHPELSGDWKSDKELYVKLINNN